MGTSSVPFGLDSAITGAIIGAVAALIGTATTVLLWFIDRKSKPVADKAIDIVFVPIERSGEALAPVVAAAFVLSVLASARRG